MTFLFMLSKLYFTVATVTCLTFTEYYTSQMTKGRLCLS